jgi:hypothetical protein
MIGEYSGFVDESVTFDLKMRSGKQPLDHNG